MEFRSISVFCNENMKSFNLVEWCEINDKKRISLTARCVDETMSRIFLSGLKCGKMMMVGWAGQQEGMKS